MDISVVIVSFHSHHLIRKIIKIIGKKIPVVVNTTVGTKPAIYPNAVSFAKMHTNNGTLD